jgi:hypothetical protein
VLYRLGLFPYGVGLGWRGGYRGFWLGFVFYFVFCRFLSFVLCFLRFLKIFFEP